MNWAPSHVGWRELREVFLPPFEAAIQNARLASVMNAYHEIDGIPCATSEAMFRTLLRDELGFDGLVVSDYFAIDMIAAYHGWPGTNRIRCAGAQGGIESSCRASTVTAIR